jgi:transcriptional regulator
MYMPGAFEEKDPAQIHAFIRENSFGLLVSQTAGNFHGTHLPFLLKEKNGVQGELLSHMAKANSQWKDMEGKEVMAVFQGPHAYISPAWYESEGVVPTWNYVAVHVFGTFRFIAQGGETLGLLREMTNNYEASSPKPWKMESQAADFIEKMAQGVTAFKIEIGRLEGKWKLSQNHPKERREKVIRALESGKNPSSIEIARLMREKEQP